MGVTIRKIAQEANVSRGTVDKVLNNRIGVSEQTRKKVKKIANELGYQPNMVAKALAYQKNPIVIGIIIPSIKNKFYEEIRHGMEKAVSELKDFGLKVERREIRVINEKNQLKILNEFEKLGVSGIALPPIDSPEIKHKLNELVNNNIQIVTFNTDINGVKRLCFVGQDLVKSGKVGAELMAAMLNGKGKVVIFTGSFNILAHNQRIKGFQHKIKNEYPDIEVVDIIETLDNNEVSYNKTLEVINIHKDIDGIFITAGGVAGIGNAIRNTCLPKKIKIVCFDIVNDTIKLIKDNIIQFTITQEPYQQGYKPIKILYDYFMKNIEPESTSINTKITIQTKETII